ncbi:MAG: PorT family protein [Prevotella sp.]|jgi:hypothetical protein|nr:PorT family protein [Prevotella sp.]
MRVLFIIIMIIASGNYTCLAQGFGIKAGVHLDNSDIKCSGVEADRKPGFEAGAFYELALPVMTAWKINVGLSYYNNRFKLQDDYGNSTGITYHFSENNLKLPVTIKYQLDYEVIKTFISGGVYSSYMFSGKIKDSESSQSIKYEKSGDKIDYGVSVGIGALLLSHVGLNINYDFGFAERNIVLGDQYVSAKNRKCSILLSYIF